MDSTVIHIRELLHQQNKSQKDLANYLGVPQQKVSNWMTGVVKSYQKYLPQIAAFFGIPVSELFSPAEDEDAQESPETSQEQSTFIGRMNALFYETGVKKTFVADRLNRNRTIFNDWEKGKSVPSDDQLEIVAEALGTTAAYLRGETDIKERHPLQTSDLTASEQEMLKAFREAGPALQRAALSVLRSAENKDQ